MRIYKPIDAIGCEEMVRHFMEMIEEKELDTKEEGKNDDERWETICATRSHYPQKEKQ